MSRLKVIIPISYMFLLEQQPYPTPDMERTPETEATFAYIDTMVNPLRRVRFPTLAEPQVQFLVPTNDTGEAVNLPLVRAERIAGLTENSEYLLDVECTYDPATGIRPGEQTYRRIIWRLGEPQPEVISQLGLEVSS